MSSLSEADVCCGGIIASYVRSLLSFLASMAITVLLLSDGLLTYKLYNYGNKW
jgi:hypothetical protein